MKRGICLVTGASSGLGRDLATLLCEQGHIVYVVARRKEKLLELKKECKQKKGEIKVIAGDLTDKKFRERVIKNILKESKRIDYLINNAGYGKLINFEGEEYEDIEGMYQLNAIAGEHLTQLVLPFMKKKKSGRIINVSSVVAFVPPVYFATYNATKHAVYGFSRTLSYELKDTGVSISVVFPARMRTPFWVVAFKCKGMTGEEQKVCRDKWMKQAGGSMPVAEYIVQHLDSKKLIFLPGFLPKIYYHFMRHFPFIMVFFAKYIMLPKTKKLLFH